MKHKIFSVYDNKAKAYLPPFFMPEEGMAIRLFKDCINDPGHQFCKNPDDYTLFNIGAWADNTAAIIANPSPISLGNGVTFIDQPNTSPELELVEETVNV